MSVRAVNVRNDLEGRWAQLLDRMAVHADLLAHQGTVAQKTVRGGQYWVLRFRSRSGDGRQRRHTIHIGPVSDLELVGRVWRVLHEYRAQANAAREVAVMAQLAGKLAATFQHMPRR